MRTVDIVIRLNGYNPEKELELESTDNYSTFYTVLQTAVASHSADVVHKGDYFRYNQHLLPKDDNEFNTYVLFRDITLNDTDDDTLLWNALDQQVQTLKYPEVREKNTHHQLIELSSVERNFVIEEDNDADFEDVLIRIEGTREELEFDASGTEANKILYDRLAKVIYNKEAEIMYKGPKLVLDDNRDLFINPDDFSVYVLLRSRRDYNYENKEQLWDNLASDLKVLSSISLHRSEKHYQVILLTHNS